jgi:hypothetical protein
MEKKTFTYHQNNSGGYFNGPESVTIEAYNEEDADRKAEESGLVYFDGVEQGIDCECCGDRWYPLGHRED